MLQRTHRPRSWKIHPVRTSACRHAGRPRTSECAIGGYHDPSGLEIEHYVVSAAFVTEDSDDPHRGKPFFPCTSEHNPDARAIAVVATRRRDDANPSQYVCQFIVMAAKKN